MFFSGTALERYGTVLEQTKESRGSLKKKLKFWESDWGDNLGKVCLTNGASKYFKNKNVEYVDMIINTIEKRNGDLYQTIIIAYYELD